MKRRTWKMAVCAAVMALTLSVVACGGDDAKSVESDNTETAAEDTDTADNTDAAEDADTANNTDAAEDTDTADNTDAAEDTDTADNTDAAEDADTADNTDAAEAADASTDAAADGTDAGEDAYKTLEDYCRDPSVKAALDSQFARFASEGMSARVEVNGNEFAVVIKIEDSALIVDGLGEALSALLDEQEAPYKELVKVYDDVIGQEGACTLIMRYTDPGDRVLAEKAYTAN